LAGWQEVSEKIRAVRVYSVADGIIQETVFHREALQEAGELRVSGYVTGIVFLCEEPMTITVEGYKASDIIENPDGTFKVKHLGSIQPSDELIPALTEMNKRLRDRDHVPGGYSCFPRVFGDSIGPGDRVDITFEHEGTKYETAILQSGPHDVQTVLSNPGAESRPVTFRFLGTSAQQLREQISDFEQRLSAIAESIYHVEKTLNTRLVETVNIVGVGEIYDAVACDGSNDIWFYVTAFREEPLAELKTIASHESIHIYVDKNRVTRDPAIRKLFADLKGYDTLSLERFMIITAGEVPAEMAQQDAPTATLLALIDEKNFLEGMKGGHSGTSIEEFCTSFIHSLLVLDRLEQTIDRPLSFANAGDEPQTLSRQEQIAVLDDYIATINALIHVLSAEEPTAESRTFLRRGLDQATGLLEKLRQTT